MTIFQGQKRYTTFSLFYFILFAGLFIWPTGCGGTIHQYNVDLSNQASMAEESVIRGDYDRAFVLYREALRSYEKEGNEKGTLFCLERMGWLKREVGHYGEALELFRRAYPMGIRLHGDAAEIDADLGDVYLLSGYSEKAEEHYKKALNTLKDFIFKTKYSRPPSKEQISTMIRKATAIVHARDNLGTLNYFEGNYKEALRHLKIGLELIKRVMTVANHPLYGMFFKLDSVIYEGIGFCHTIMAATYGEIGEFDKAYEQFRIGREAFAKGEKHYGLLLNGALRLKTEFLDPDIKVDKQKLTEYDKFLEKTDNFGAQDIIWRMCFVIGKALVKEKMYPEARAYLVRAIEALELTRSRLREDTVKKMFAASVQDVYAEMIRLLFHMNEFEQGFDYLERAKARAFLDMLAGRSVKAKRSVDPLLINKEKEIQKKIDVLARRLRTLRGEGRKDTHKAYKTLLNERKNILETIKGQSLEFAATTTVTTVEAREIADKIDRGTVLISYFLGQNRTLIWVLRKGAISAVAVDMGKASLGSLIASYRDAIYNQNDIFIRNMGEMLSGSLIEPLLDKIEGARKLIIIPSGSLHYLPFASLPLSENRFLIQEYAVSVLPNASSLFFLDKKVSKDKESIFAMGNPELNDPALSLKYAEQEVKSIAKTFKKSTALLGNQAKETYFKERNLIDTGFIHIAAHGKYNVRQPLKSALLLAKDEKNDGRLETFEIFSLSMNPRLVVLSACESGIGKIGGGDEVQSLNRAFLYAGAGGVMASLWSVSDISAYELMEHFYRAVNEMPMAEALREAQLKVMEKYPSPFHWAPFYLTGGISR